MPNDLSFEQIVHDHRPMVFRTLARLTGPGSDRLDDLAQDVFLRLFRALPNFRGESAVSTYLYRIVVNVAQNEWKRRRREDRTHVSLSEEEDPLEDRLAHPGAGALEQMQQSEFAALVDLRLNALSAMERNVLVLYHQEERSYEQIAAILALPIGTVRTHLHRGRNKLRASLLSQPMHVKQPVSVKGPAHGR